MGTNKKKTISILSQNLWLIPFGGAWFLGRGTRCSHHVESQALAQASTTVTTDLTVFAIQEAWSFQAGVWYPLLYLLSLFQQCVCCLGALGLEPGREPLWARALSLPITALVTVTQAWLPLGDLTRWDPKPQIARALRK